MTCVGWVTSKTRPETKKKLSPYQGYTLFRLNQALNQVWVVQQNQSFSVSPKHPTKRKDTPLSTRPPTTVSKQGPSTVCFTVLNPLHWVEREPPTNSTKRQFYQTKVFNALTSSKAPVDSVYPKGLSVESSGC